ncbi:TIGR04086 family membrane protein [Halonatronum saccharophilum]|uniref:TIGR04086 family membrane protein n=1 Tax=Halonatronum saccharophilum TaxID=150060 RepID=UPI0004889AF6|nr:TIGR04086 family membrane protein [Halonatronum saccharophilum]
MPEARNEGLGIKVSGILIGLLVSLAILLVGSFILGLIINFSSLSNNSASRVLFITNYFAIFVGGIVSAYLAGSKGWINGGLVGLVYMGSIILLGSLWNPVVFSLGLGLRVGIGFLISALGGMIGVNII